MSSHINLGKDCEQYSCKMQGSLKPHDRMSLEHYISKCS